MCLGFWKLLEKSHTYVTIMNQNFIFTFDYLFDTIKVTTKKIDMVRHYEIINWILDYKQNKRCVGFSMQ